MHCCNLLESPCERCQFELEIVWRDRAQQDLSLRRRVAEMTGITEKKRLELIASYKRRFSRINNLELLRAHCERCFQLSEVPSK